MEIEIHIIISKNDYLKWRKKYGKEYVDRVLVNELQLYADNFDSDLMENYKEVFPDSLSNK